MATFRTVLESTGGNNIGIVVPEETVQSFGRGKRVPVIVTIDGGYTYKTTIGVMGGRYLVLKQAHGAVLGAKGRGLRSDW
jgi:hypothetical protein